MNKAAQDTSGYTKRTSYHIQVKARFVLNKHIFFQGYEWALPPHAF